MFRLIKWYLDAVAPDGRAVIVYAARAQWGALAIRYSSVSYSVPGSAVEERATIRGVRAPRGTAGALSWSSAVLGASGTWRSPASPIEETLYQGEAGQIHWCCRMPRARVGFRWGDRTLRGLGYAERLRVTLPPWKLPFRTLRWGRYGSSRHDLVWIDWDGIPGRADQPPRCWIWLDGRRRTEARMAATAVSELGGGLAHRVGDRRTLRDHRVLKALRPLVPGLSRAAGRLGEIREQKWLSRAELIGSRGSRDRGWTIHEVVRW